MVGWNGWTTIYLLRSVSVSVCVDDFHDIKTVDYTTYTCILTGKKGTRDYGNVEQVIWEHCDEHGVEGGSADEGGVDYVIGDEG